MVISIVCSMTIVSIIDVTPIIESFDIKVEATPQKSTNFGNSGKLIACIEYF